MEIRTIPGMGPCLVFETTDGLRQRVRLNSIQTVGDSDDMRNEMTLVVAGRTYMLPESLDAFDRVVAEHDGDVNRY